MNNITYKNLSDFVTQLESGGRPKGGGKEKGDIPSLGAEHLNKFGKFNFDNLKFIPHDYYKSMTKGIIQNDDILVVKDGATTGKVAIVRKDFPFNEAAVNEHLFIVRVDKTQLEPKFLFYYLFSGVGQNYILRGFHGSAQGGIIKSFIDNIKIPLFDLKTQRRIAFLLEICESAIQKRKTANRLTDEFLKSTFLEMFGDPVQNPKGWEKKTVGEVAENEKGAIKCGPFGSQLLLSELQDEGIPVYGIDNVQINEFVWAKPKYVTEKKFQELKSFAIKADDILISRTGTVGRACLAPPKIQRSIIGPNLLKVTLNKELLLPVVFSIGLNYCRTVTQTIKNMSPGATVAVFNTTNLKSLKFAIPPMHLQQKFVGIVQKVEKLKEKQRESQKELTNLFHSLMQRAFRGEL